VLRGERRQWLVGRSWRALEQILGTPVARRLSRWHPALHDEAVYRAWLKAQAPVTSELERQRHESATWTAAPLLSVIMPVFQPPPDAFIAAVQSLQAQTYGRWELCVADASASGEAFRWLEQQAQVEPRIRPLRLSANGGISANSNAALAMAKGDFVAFLDHDDVLTPDALFEVASRIRARPDVDLLYSDKDNITPWGERYAPFLKPGWSPELLLSANYLTHLTVVRRQALSAAGPLDPAMDGAQDWDLFLRVTERGARVAHIPRVLYHWRSVATSCASTMLAKPYALNAQRRAVSSHLARRGIAARVGHERSGALRIRPHERAGLGVATVPYVADGRGWGERMNAAAATATRELLLFLDPGLEAPEAHAIDELGFWADLPGIGAAGARVIGRHGRVERTGLVLSGAGEPHELLADIRGGRWSMAGSTEWYRNLLAVGHGCLVTSRRVFDALGGFSPTLNARAAVIDYGLRVHEAGLRNVHVPFVTVGGARSWPSSFGASDLPPRLSRYRATADPFFSPHLPLSSEGGARSAQRE
jgi:GT2 family glycosyltransferase